MSVQTEDSTGGRENVQQASGDDFFSVGTPLHAVKAGYVKRRADDQLYEEVLYFHPFVKGFKKLYSVFRGGVYPSKRMRTSNSSWGAKVAVASPASPPARNKPCLHAAI